jgi:hypothetical protein
VHEQFFIAKDESNAGSVFHPCARFLMFKVTRIISNRSLGLQSISRYDSSLTPAVPTRGKYGAHCKGDDDDDLALV